MKSISDLAREIAALRDSVGSGRFNPSEAPLEQIADFLMPLLSQGAELLTPAQRQPDSAERRKVALWSDPADQFVILATIWSPGQFTAIHDHEYWDVSGMLCGVLLETLYTSCDGDDVVPTLARFHYAGATWPVSPTGPNIHTLRNPTRDVVISLNIHGTGAGRFQRNAVRQFALSPQFLSLYPGA